MLTENGRFRGKLGFTFAEILITLGIIGVVAAITIPILQKTFQEMEYKTAYKKAYSDLNQAFRTVQSNNDFITLDGTIVNAQYNFSLIQNQFKVVKSCTNALVESCWIDGCMSQGDCFYTHTTDQGQSLGFVDASGRMWIHYKTSGVLILIVDTNGNKLPNKLGRDRFPFQIYDQSGNYTGIPYKVVIPDDVISTNPTACSLGNCYYKTWLFN